MKESAKGRFFENFDPTQEDSCIFFLSDNKNIISLKLYLPYLEKTISAFYEKSTTQCLKQILNSWVKSCPNPNLVWNNQFWQVIQES